ncbi:cysteinyl-tRNA synthetase [Acidothermus cellulolyticus 11B]|uniref:L-cysteine:1D-myo-inositol 2-amino-2-deoxy-alpha-D-glucopyranoside ligase n=1 Tax=Acidothermus cellulolyticus (strain ATCC 43068 / DSM 8971 / 11B) TaxID=351607 RepID=MSHC_ACIC1|nr:cysteine--1-D-myo-inosityl 2-amino-2-deoxy-alpha-D-glucopyranoside ligase [Acidothermus cellulolyticus]A0LU34.1 RecName: Full=L-cysteine:1D-myo-inositol 2-amino-2-deoxy-alpha-D-glucopyranoside ligase; Short=L-Cys:GlcN-Ins ligase; AltName: Full=Mycothiol ligase; Short=MSH ligase [Acidothermus cellulolyticus 11B]ABK52944.1 cysteinyl-tRNA synthetase [Acidothermus cellulolyticus 11B]
MHAWPAPKIPSLPGRNRLPSLFDTASRRLVTVGSQQGASMYVCGITPYDATHLGHAATYVAFDLLVRTWHDAGVTVRYAQNVTDVDDPLLERARQVDQPWEAIAARETAKFRADMAALRVVPPDRYVGVVESLPQIIGLIEVLRSRGLTYELDGDQYFATHAIPDFGAVSHLGRDDMIALFAARGGDPDRAGKKDPLDALLWRGKRPEEPSWPAPFGRGRPGWHVECAAIALTHLPLPLDVQGGGADLVFPHHDMTAAQAEAATGRRFARAYVHTGLVAYQGEKMSKSLGNLVFVSDLCAAGADPMAVRLALLDHHYRTEWEWTPRLLDEATDRLAEWRAAVRRPRGAPGDGLLAAVRDRLADDLDAPGAIALIDEWTTQDGDDPDAPTLVAAMADALLGVHL